MNNADWGLRGQLITNHIKSQIMQGQWAPGQKLPSARRLAQEYGVCIETVRNALRELNGQGLVVTRPRSGTVVSERQATNVPTASKDVAYVRLLNLEQVPGRHASDDILHTLEAPLLERGLHLSLVTQPPQAPQRARLMAQRLEKMLPQLAGVILQRPPADLLEAILPLLDQHKMPFLILGRRSHQDMNNYLDPDFIGMGIVIGRYLASIGAKRILLPGLSFTEAHHYSGVLRYQGILEGYLQLEHTPPEFIPLTCQAVTERECYEQTKKWLAGRRQMPDAIVAHGDSMAMGAMTACQERGLRIPQDIVVFGTSGLAAAAYCSPTLTTADQQQPVIAQTAAEMLSDMIRNQQMICHGRFTPVRFHFRQSAPMRDEARKALASAIQDGLIDVEDK